MNLLLIFLTRAYASLLHLYPSRFKHQFSNEMQTVFDDLAHETAKEGLVPLLVVLLKELGQLPGNLFLEFWHERVSRGERTAIVMENQAQESIGTEKVGNPGLPWVLGWTVLITTAIPLALFGMPPFAVLGIWLSNLGVHTGFWTMPPSSVLEGSGMVFSLALALAFFQWLMLHKWVPQAWKWSLATILGLLAGSLLAALLFRIFHIQWTSRWTLTIPLLTISLVLGLAHWQYLRRFLAHASWIILIDILAVGSLLLLGQPITSMAGLSVFILPGVISGLGMWILFKQSHLQSDIQIEGLSRHGKRWIWVGMGIVALVPIFFGCLWIYAASQLALAKNDGVYPTVEEAVIAINSRGWGGAKVIRIENVHAEPNRFDGSQPHVWFGGATVQFDRIPQGGHRDWELAGSFYIHIRDGWVFVPEGAFPELIGSVMELYHMEGLDEYRQSLGKP